MAGLLACGDCGGLDIAVVLGEVTTILLERAKQQWTGWRQVTAENANALAKVLASFPASRIAG